MKTLIIILCLAFTKGYKAWVMYVDTGIEIHNPYKANSKNWQEWQRGWHSSYNGVSNIEK